MSSKLPYISVVICSLNGEHRIGSSLESILHQTYPKDKIEIIVVDDGSNDRTAEIALSYGARVISLSHNMGRAAARNFGWKVANSEIILFTDDDCIADPGWAKILVKQFKSNVAAVGGRIIASRNQTLCERYLSAIGYGNPWLEAFGVSKNPLRRFLTYISNMAAPAVSETKYTQARAIFTGNAAYRREVLETLNGFDESLLTSEDTDLSTRTLSKYPNKHIIYQPTAIVAHSHETSIWRFASQTFRRANNTLIYYRKNKEFPPIYPFPLIILVVSITFLFIAPLTLPLVIVVLPLIAYPWWTVRSIRDHNPRVPFFAYCQFLCESAEIIGLGAGALRVFSNKRLPPPERAKSTVRKTLSIKENTSIFLYISSTRGYLFDSR